MDAIVANTASDWDSYRAYLKYVMSSSCVVTSQHLGGMGVDPTFFGLTVSELEKPHSTGKQPWNVPFQISKKILLQEAGSSSNPPFFQGAILIILLIFWGGKKRKYQPATANRFVVLWCGSGARNSVETISPQEECDWLNVMRFRIEGWSRLWFFG